jgi:tRNA (guanine37-N1)-methyltransferase
MRLITCLQVSDLVRGYCEDGREFIQKSVERVWDNPFAPYTGPKLSRVQEEKERKRIQKLAAEGKPVSSPVTTQVDASQMRRTVSHFVMNLPDSAITFLDAFRGIIPESDPKLREAYEVMPMIHCHCFTRELEQDQAEADIQRVSCSHSGLSDYRTWLTQRGWQRVEEQLGCPLTDEVSYHHVRSVAPSKEMYCISFRLPAECAVRRE